MGMSMQLSFPILPPQHESQDSRDDTAKNAQPDWNVHTICHDVHLKNQPQQMGNGNDHKENRDNGGYRFHDQIPSLALSLTPIVYLFK